MQAVQVFVSDHVQNIITAYYYMLLHISFRVAVQMRSALQELQTGDIEKARAVYDAGAWGDFQRWRPQKSRPEEWAKWTWGQPKVRFTMVYRFNYPPIISNFLVIFKLIVEVLPAFCNGNGPQIRGWQWRETIPKWPSKTGWNDQNPSISVAEALLKVVPHKQFSFAKARKPSFFWDSQWSQCQVCWIIESKSTTDLLQYTSNTRILKRTRLQYGSCCKNDPCGQTTPMKSDSSHSNGWLR